MPNNNKEQRSSTTNRLSLAASSHKLRTKRKAGVDYNIKYGYIVCLHTGKEEIEVHAADTVAYKFGMNQQPLLLCGE